MREEGRTLLVATAIALSSLLSGCNADCMDPAEAHGWRRWSEQRMLGVHLVCQNRLAYDGVEITGAALTGS